MDLDGLEHRIRRLEQRLDNVGRAYSGAQQSAGTVSQTPGQPLDDATEARISDLVTRMEKFEAGESEGLLSFQQALVETAERVERAFDALNARIERLEGVSQDPRPQPDPRPDQQQAATNESDPTKQPGY